MSFTILCPRRLIALLVSVSADKAGFDWQNAYISPLAFQEYIAKEQPHYALITDDYIGYTTMFSDLKMASPNTVLVLCITSDTDLVKPQLIALDDLEFDVICTIDELTDCLVALKTGRFYQSSLLKTKSSLKRTYKCQAGNVSQLWNRRCYHYYLQA